MSMADFPARSWLFVPGDSERKLEKIGATGADAVILDLEDSVSPDRKAAARDRVRGALERRAGNARLYVRINADRDDALRDLSAVMPAAPDGIMLPKCEGAADVDRLSHWLDAFEAASNLPPGGVAILPVATETARAVLRLDTFLDGNRPRLAGLTWGAEDLGAALGASTNRDATGAWALVYRMARAQVLLTAKAIGVAAIDTLHGNYRDLDGLRDSSHAAAGEGFVGRLAIHPGQVETINACFQPSQDELEHARRVVAAFEEAGDAGVVGLDGQMLDRPHLVQARATLARARV